MMDVKEWIHPDGFLSFYHKSHVDHLVPFEDTCDSTAIWLTQEYMNGSMSKSEIHDFLWCGFRTRLTRLSFKRHATSTTPMKRDQLDWLIPLMREVGFGDIANVIVERDAGFLLPHQSDHFWNEDTFFGRVFESGDSISDWYSNSESSQMNNISRLLWASFHGHKNETAVKLFKKKIDPWRVVVIYGARRPESQESQYDEIYEKAIYQGADENDPPPIFKGFHGILKEFL